MIQKVILITGANSGVGYAAAKVIASHSADFHVIMTGRSIEKVQAAMSTLTSQGVKGELSALALEVTDTESITAAVRAVESTHGRLDVLINNAGVGCRVPDLKTRLMECLTINAVGSALVAEAFRPLLMKSPKPYSIYVSSGAGSFTHDVPLNAFSLQYDEAYRVSKAAQNMIALREHAEYGEKGLKVFAVSPGCVVSNLRGTSEEERNAWGMAGDPDVSGHTLLRIVLGERDGDVGKMIKKDGVYPW